MNKIMILLVVFLLISVVPSFIYGAEIYEKDGCIYIIGNLTNKEKQTDLENYRQRMIKRETQINAGIQSRHEIKIETIKAQAMRDYLIAQTTPLREVADALRHLKIRQNVVIGDTTNISSSTSEGGSATATGTGGTSTHNDY